jgi:hypothetical protein
MKASVRSKWAPHQTFDWWFKELKRIAVEHFDFTKESAESFDADAYYEYYKWMYSPQAALVEDLSYS